MAYAYYFAASGALSEVRENFAKNFGGAVSQRDLSRAERGLAPVGLLCPNL